MFSSSSAETRTRSTPSTPGRFEEALLLPGRDGRQSLLASPGAQEFGRERILSISNFNNDSAE